MFELTGLVHLVIAILVIGLVFWLLTYIINAVNPPEPFKKVATVVLMVVGALILIGILLQFVGVKLF